RAALGELANPELLRVVAEELLADEDTLDLDEAGDLVDRLLAAARRPQQVAVARWIAAYVAELQGEALAADRHLRAALIADPLWEPAVDRAAWYASDRGDAATAVELLRRVGPEDTPELALMERHLPGPPGRLPGRLPGRNEPCWCGSGRKFKQCHLGRAELDPLPDRIDWLYSKAVRYLEHQGREARIDLLEYARARAVDPEDEHSMREAFADPLVTDVTLLEGGWFYRFVEDRSPLLPDDEALLAQTWALVPRTVYEVVEVTPGAGMVVRDLVAGERLPVRERSFSTQAKVGWLVCARVVPDGATHQFVGAVFPVPPGTESELLERCKEEDGFGICEFARRRFLPPIMTTTDGEPIVTCTATFEVPDAAALRRFLDARYRGEGEGERWRAAGSPDGITRATFALEEDRLTVTTISEARMDWALGELEEGMPDLTLLDEERLPVRPDRTGPLPTGGRGMEFPDTPEARAALAQFQDDAERKWVREPVPALGGSTPLEAVADPTRIEEVERLIASFPEPEQLGPGWFGFRPNRLRELLGLPAPE
ncbi:MAG TPA: SEC-C metal-binding domain-containing protein, partial [Actinomycetota bacterium]|nr:SEC-C metal-binding domain-containing protein [Actinomycetota bacterium]